MPALDPSEIESAAPDAWTGKLTSLTYWAEGEVAAFLVKRGATSYSTRTADEKAADLVVVTGVVEDVLREQFRGRAIVPDQGLLFPARGAYDSRGRLIMFDSAPRPYLEGIALLAEEKASGTFMPTTGEDANLKREDGPDTEFEYFQGDRESLAAQHPAAWRKIQAAFPKDFLP